MRRTSEQSDEARAKGAKRGKNSWGGGVGGCCKPPQWGPGAEPLVGSGAEPQKNWVYNCQECNFKQKKSYEVEIKNAEIRVSMEISHACCMPNWRAMEILWN